MAFKYWRLYLSLMASFLSYMSVGMVISYPSPAFSDINKGHYNFKLSINMMSWLSSFDGIFGIPGAIIAGPLMDHYGRKFVLLITTLPMAAGCMVMLAAFNVITLAVGRAITGVAMGMQCACLFVYISEISPKHMRGSLSLVTVVFYGSGALLLNVLGAFSNWRWVTVACLAVATATATTGLFMYETPRWLVSKGHRDIASEVIQSVWNIEDVEIVKQEINDAESHIKLVSSVTFFQGLKQLFTPPLWKPLVITQMLIMFQQFTGLTYVNTYTVQIFQDAISNSPINNPLLSNSNYQSCLASVSYVLGGIASLFVIDRFGRRVLLIVSGTLMAISLGAVGAYYYVQTIDPVSAGLYLYWIPLISLIVYILNVSAAYAAVPLLMLNELFPLHVRAIANSLGNFSRNLYIFIVVKVFLTVTNVPKHGIFWIFAGFSIMCVAFVMFFVPETKGLTLEEIQKHWYPSKKSNYPEKHLSFNDKDVKGNYITHL